MRHVAVVLRSLSAVGLLVGFTFSCGNDTSSEPGDEDSSSGSGATSGDAGGTGGSGGSGTSGSGGSGGSGGVSTSSGGTSTGAGGGVNTVNTAASTTGNAAGAGNLPEETPGLAEPCGSDDDCESDLICLAADSNALLQGGPSNGMCTSPCDEDNPCALDAACIIFGEDGYCMPMCGIADGVQDCAERSDAVCDVLPVGVSCTSDADCGGGTVCVGTDCMLPVCLPKCGVDSDCPDGRFCDPSYGECVDEEPVGGGLSELCDPEGDAEECQGFCAGDDETARCLETCAFGIFPGCGSESETSGTAACLDPYLATVIDAEYSDPGDLGLCVGLCDCNSDCPDDGMVCVSFESVEGFEETEVLGRPGFCVIVPEDPTMLDDVEVLTCEE